jgi:hypothetical protein
MTQYSVFYTGGWTLFLFRQLPVLSLTLFLNAMTHRRQHKNTQHHTPAMLGCGDKVCNRFCRYICGKRAAQAALFPLFWFFFTDKPNSAIGLMLPHPHAPMSLYSPPPRSQHPFDGKNGVNNAGLRAGVVCVV